MAGTPLQFVVGLGNPGPEHRLTRHNAGFWFVDALAYRHGAQFRSHARYQGEIAKVTRGGHGTRAAQAADVHESQRPFDPRADGLHQGTRRGVLVVHDELDLPCGVARLKLGGGHGGHNGLRDTITHCGADFWRLRLGIGHPGDKSEVIDYVLQRARPAEENAIVDAIDLGMKRWLPSCVTAPRRPCTGCTASPS